MLGTDERGMVVNLDSDGKPLEARVMKQIEIIKGTRAGGQRCKVGKVLSVGSDINEKDARFLVATGAAIEAKSGAKDKAEGDDGKDGGKGGKAPAK